MVGPGRPCFVTFSLHCAAYADYPIADLLDLEILQQTSYHECSSHATHSSSNLSSDRLKHPTYQPFWAIFSGFTSHDLGHFDIQQRQAIIPIQRLHSLHLERQTGFIVGRTTRLQAPLSLAGLYPSRDASSPGHFSQCYCD